MSLMDKLLVTAAHIRKKILFLCFGLSIYNSVLLFTLNTIIDQLINCSINRDKG